MKRKKEREKGIFVRKLKEIKEERNKDRNIGKETKRKKERKKYW